MHVANIMQVSRVLIETTSPKTLRYRASITEVIDNTVFISLSLLRMAAQYSTVMKFNEHSATGSHTLGNVLSYRVLTLKPTEFRIQNYSISKLNTVSACSVANRYRIKNR